MMVIENCFCPNFIPLSQKVTAFAAKKKKNIVIDMFVQNVTLVRTTCPLNVLDLLLCYRYFCLLNALLN